MMFVIEGKNMTLAETDSSRVAKTAEQAGLPAKITSWARDHYPATLFRTDQWTRLESWTIGAPRHG